MIIKPRTQDRLVNTHNIAPPPPGFEDNEFYLTETHPADNGQQCVNDDNGTSHANNLNLVQRRQRPKMTLSFAGLSSPTSSGPGAPGQIARTLMFATNSPFALNDCVEVDPNLPLDHQEYVLQFASYIHLCVFNKQHYAKKARFHYGISVFSAGTMEVSLEMKPKIF